MSDSIPYYKRIYADISLSEYALSDIGNPTNDEAMYNLASYHAQQAIEKGLKFYLSAVYGEDENDRRFKIHDIDTLCYRLKSRYGFEVDSRIIEMAEELER